MLVIKLAVRCSEIGARVAISHSRVNDALLSGTFHLDLIATPKNKDATVSNTQAVS